MLHALLTSTCNTFEGIIDVYDVVLTSLSKNRDKDTEVLVTELMTDMSLALVERPAFRRIMAMTCAGVIASDRFAQGDDYNTAMNESRDLCLAAFNRSTFMLDVYRLYTSKKDAIIAVFKDLDGQLDPDSPFEQYDVLIKVFRQVFDILRPALAVAA
jgi:hypothetical protein